MPPNPTYPNHTVLVAWFLGCLVTAPDVVHATQTPITGTVTDSLSGLAISGARVGIRGSGADAIARVETSARGRFRLTVPPGQYRIEVEAIGYRATAFDFTLVEGTAPLHVGLARLPLQLAPVEVVSRTTEQLLSAPGAVSLLTGATIAERNTMVASDYLHSAPGIDIANKGLAQATFSARGPSSGNSASLLVLRDYRLASLPSLRLNVPYFIPGTSDDLERIEVARGPSSAVYGADADRGVVHFISRSPFASRGASVDLSAGERSVRKAEARIAGTLSEKVGFKISGEYLRGVDWEFHDPNEVLPRDSLVERAGGEARLDWRPDDETTLVFSGGLTSAIRNVDLTPVSTVQVRDWRYWFGQFRLTHDRLALNTFYNASDAGESVLLYSGQPLVDQSRLWSAQVQHGLQLSPSFDVIYGADVQVVEPRTGGTYHGRYEADDDITQTGAFVNGTIALAPRWTLVAAARVDHHSRLDDLAVSPRVGVVFEPGSNHALRLTLNRATSTPTATDLFLDIHGGDLGPLPFEVRARGAITPYTFRRDCAGGVCMRSPFTGDATAFLPLDATLAWSGLVAILQSQGVDISSIPRPGPSDVASVLGRLNPETRTFDPVGVADVVDIPAAARRFNSTLETGYRGVPASGLMVSVDVYWSHLTNAASVREVQTPNVFLDQATLGGYLGRFMPAQQAAAIAGAAAGIPLGTISPEEGDSTELLSLTREGSTATFWGADFTATADLSRSVSISGTYSWTSKDVIPSSGGFGDIVMNAPQHKGSLGLRYSRSRLTADLRGRAVSGFPVQSGVQVGRVEAYLIVDSGVSCVVFRNPALTMSLTASNLLDNRHQEFVGAPAIGRLVLVRLRAAL